MKIICQKVAQSKSECQSNEVKWQQQLQRLFLHGHTIDPAGPKYAPFKAGHIYCKHN